VELSGLGEYLRVERERRGITLEQVASATKINVKLLQALEGDQFVDLPAKPFVRGFVISYSRFVGLDPKEVLTQFQSFLEEKVQERPAHVALDIGYSEERQSNERSRKLLGGVLIICVILSFVVLAFLKPSLKHKHLAHLEQLRQAHEKEGADPGNSAAALTSKNIPYVLSPKLLEEALNRPLAPPAVTPQEAQVPAKTNEKTETKVIVAAQPPKPEVKPEVKPEPKPEIKVDAKIEAKPESKPKGDSPYIGKDPTRTAAETDPLNKGDKLSGAEVNFKVVLKTTSNINVRYQVDDLGMMRYHLVKDKMLVLRGKQNVWFQSSDPSSLLVRMKNGQYKPMSEIQELKTLGKSPTFGFPSNHLDETREKLERLEALPAPPASAPAQNQPQSTGTNNPGT